MHSGHADEPGAQDVARLHLQIEGETHDVEVALPLGERSLVDLLPAAAAIAARISEVTKRRAAGEGRQVSCTKGCGACCRQLVAISYVEALAIQDLVSRLPPERQAVVRARFADSVRRLEEAGLLDPREPRGDRAIQVRRLGDKERSVLESAARYFRLQIACPFLEDESCGIYPQWPMVCGEYLVTSPAERCGLLFDTGVERLDRPLRMGEALAHAAHAVAGLPVVMIPLVLALEWAEVHGEKLRVRRDGVELLRILMGVLDRRCDQPFAQRDGLG
jgi:Fe-S-cluster containining protein